VGQGHRWIQREHSFPISPHIPGCLDQTYDRDFA
jgi:hypothetical protein